MAGVEEPGDNLPPGAREFEFEFDDAQNTVMRRLSATMRFVGIINLIGALLYGLSGLIRLGQSALHPNESDIASFLLTGSMCALFYFTGTWTTHAAGSFRSIATTAGSDVSNLMNALGDLLKLYRLQRVLIIASLSVAAVGLVLMLLAMLVGSGSGGPAA